MKNTAVKTRSTRHFDSVVTEDDMLEAIEYGSWLLKDAVGRPRLFTHSELVELIRTRQPDFKISRRKAALLGAGVGAVHYLYELTLIFEEGNVRTPQGPRPGVEAIQVCSRCFLELPVSGECDCGL